MSRKALVKKQTTEKSSQPTLEPLVKVAIEGEPRVEDVVEAEVSKPKVVEIEVAEAVGSKVKAKAQELPPAMFLSARSRSHGLALVQQFIPTFADEDMPPIVDAIAAGRLVAILNDEDEFKVEVTDKRFFDEGVEAAVRASYGGSLRTVINSQLVDARLLWKL